MGHLCTVSERCPQWERTGRWAGGRPSCEKTKAPLPLGRCSPKPGLLACWELAMDFYPHLPPRAGPLIKWPWQLQIPVLGSLCYIVGVFGDLKGSVIRNLLQHGAMFETKPEDDFIYNCNRYKLLHDSWDIRMSHFCTVWIKLSLTRPPLSELARSSVVAIWSSLPFPDYLRQLRGDGVGKGCVLSWGTVQVSVVAFPLARCPHHLSGVLTSLKQESDQLVQVLP